MKNVFLLFLLLAPTAYGQQPPKTYYDYVKKAGGLREQLQYKAAAQAYSAAFSVNSGGAFPEDRYNAACAWSLAGGADSAFCYLQRLVDREHYDAYVQAPADPDFIPLQKDSRWKPLLTQMRDKKDSLEALLDKPLVAQLNAVYRSDQTLRRQVETTEHKWGFQSPQMKALWAKINSNDSLNLLVVKRILDTRGWLGAAVVGQQGNATLFLVIQHADVKTQEHYLPMMRQAVLDGKAQPDNLALLEDRVLLQNGKPQLYGSQISGDPQTGQNYLSPLADPDNVDVRRARMGLEPLADYLKYWNLKWDVEAYKKELPALELKQWGKRK